MQARTAAGKVAPATPSPQAGALLVRTISTAEHLGFVAARDSASFLQLPAWGAVKPGWRSESLGWETPRGRLVGAGLVLSRPVPGTRRSLAYLPEGPLIDWASPDLAAWLRPMVAHLRAGGAFGVRMGPPVPTRHWEAATVKAAVAAGTVTSLPDLPPDGLDASAAGVADQLRELGWHAPGADAGFGAGQPRYVFQVPLAGRSVEAIFAGFNQQWRRNIRIAERAGVEVRRGGLDDLPAFHSLYVETARRDGFGPRPAGYFPRMWRALNGEHPDRLRLYLAQRDGEVLAAALTVQVGTHAWYSYGASGEAGRDLRPSNALQWRMLLDARERGAEVYDMRGIGAGLGPADPLFGLTRFKLGTGGRAVEYLGEWELPISRLLHSAVTAYLARR
jgi:lipid II:glycine glycyltransferase (peptidoglycan interpeptide bridge formation enzyme)